MFSYLNRLRLLSVIFLLLFLLLTARLAYLQVVQHEFYADKADRQYQRQSTAVNDRGSIFFSRKDGTLVSAATMQNGFILAVNPIRFLKPEESFTKLKVLLPDLDHDGFITKASKIDDPYEEVAVKVDEEVAVKIVGLDLAGVEVVKARWRVYPAGNLAAHVLGFMGYEESGKKLVGRYGLEKQFDNILSRDADQSFVAFLAEILSEIGTVATGQDDADQKADLILTLEPQVVETLESELRAVKEQYQAESVGGIIMDPNTGEIVALMALPDFEPGGKISDLALLAIPWSRTSTRWVRL